MPNLQWVPTKETMANTILLAVNGREQEIDAGLTLMELLALLEVNQNHVAVEVNEHLVPRESHEDCVLSAGDAIEIVTFVGGG